MLKMVIIVGAEHILLRINVSKQVVEQSSGNKANDRRRTKIPSQEWILDNTSEGKTKSISNTGTEQVEGGDERSHVLGCARVGETVGWDVDEEFGDTAKRVWNCHPPDANVCNEGVAVCVNARCAGTVVTARTNLVCVAGGMVSIMLWMEFWKYRNLLVQNSVTDSTDCREEKTKGDTSDWAKVDVLRSEVWVKEVIKHWRHDDN